MSSVDPITIRPQQIPPSQASGSSRNPPSPPTSSSSTSNLDPRANATSSNIGSWLSTASLGPPSPGSNVGNKKNSQLLPGPGSGLTISLPPPRSGPINANTNSNNPTSTSTTPGTTGTQQQQVLLPWSKEELILKSPTLEATQALSQSFGSLGMGMGMVGSVSPTRTAHPLSLKDFDPDEITEQEVMNQPDEGIQMGENTVPPPSAGRRVGAGRGRGQGSSGFTRDDTREDSEDPLSPGAGSVPIPVPGQAQAQGQGQGQGGVRGRRGSVSAYLSGMVLPINVPSPNSNNNPTTSNPGTSINTNNNNNSNNSNKGGSAAGSAFGSLGQGPISPPILSASATAAWGKSQGITKVDGAGIAGGGVAGQGGQGGVVDGKLERGHGVLRRLSLGGSAARPVVKRPTPPATNQDFVNPFDRQTVVSSGPPEIRIDRPTDPGQPVPDHSRSLPGSSMDGPRQASKTSHSSSTASSALAYSNPFSGFSHSFDDHEHHDEEHAYERAFGRVGGSLLGRTKSIGSAGEVEREVAAGGMRPRRVSFGWTGFSKPSPAPSAPQVQEKKPMAGGRPDGLPAGPGSGGLKVGRGRSGSGSAGAGGGKKRSVSPMSEHLLRGSGHF